MRRLTSFFKLPQSLPFPRNIRFRKAVAEADKLFYDVIEQRRNDAGDHVDLLAMLMSARDEETGSIMSDKELRDQALTIIGAGYETTTQALVWTWYLLSKNPEAEKKLHAEIDQVIGNRPPRPEDFPSLPYTRMVLAEFPDMETARKFYDSAQYVEARAKRAGATEYFRMVVVQGVEPK